MSSSTLARILPIPFLSGSVLLAAIWGGQADAATRVVANCNDSGAGSLRNAVNRASSGDAIDMTGLACGKIALQRAITLPQDDIVLLGPGSLALTVNGGNHGRVFLHTGSGTLRLYRLSVAYGRYRAVEAYGGCIYSTGDVELIDSRVHHCQALRGGSLEPYAAGGAVLARKVLLSQSSVFASLAEQGAGGGVNGGEVTIVRSQVSNNEAYDGGGAYGGSMTVSNSVIRNNRGSTGGGLHGGLRLVVKNSTVSGNVAVNEAGGVYGATDETRIINSTISGNSAYEAGAAYLRPYTFVVGSTIAFNESRRDDECSAALTMFRDSLLVSSIVARNTCLGGSPVDIRVVDFGTGTVSGGHNLIGAANGPVPGDTISGDPRLGPLADNGGPTPTHLPAVGSPAIDKGANLLSQDYDQRGPGFPRVQPGLADIGAVER